MVGDLLENVWRDMCSKCCGGEGYFAKIIR